MKPKQVPGVKEIARRANVAIATVDRVLHNRAGVSAKTRDKINQLIAELNYQPNLMARRLASGKVLRLAVLMPAVTGDTNFWEAPWQGVRRAETEINAFGVQLRPYVFDLRDPQSFARQAEQVLADSVDGLVMAPSFVGEAHRLAAACQAAGVPCVLVDSNLPAGERLSYIGPPLFESGYLAGKLCTYTLPAQSRVLLLQLGGSAPANEPVERGFRTYIAENKKGCSVQQTSLVPASLLATQTQLANLLTGSDAFQAIFVTNSRAFLVAQFLEKHGQEAARQYPKPVLVGVDFIPENKQYLRAGLIDFLIAHRPEEQGYRSVMALYQSLVLTVPVAAEQYMPIDIITRENMDFYHN